MKFGVQQNICNLMIVMWGNMTIFKIVEMADGFRIESRFWP